MSPLISVVVCTRNRAALLRDVLETLCRQELASERYEILVVDNLSEDESADIVAQIARDHPNVRRALETEEGLSHARNRGWREARGSWVAYIDDDCKVPSRWLEVAARIIRDHEPAAFGGPFYAFYNTPKPAWFKDEYGSRMPADRLSESVDPAQLFGGNLFIRRSILESLGGFDPQLGMAGDTVAYGEETHLLRRLRRQEPEARLLYSPDLFVHHLVRPEKFRLSWLVRSFFGKGRSVYLSAGGEPPSGAARASVLVAAARAAAALVIDLTWGMLRRDRRRYPYAMNYFYEHSSGYVQALGRCQSQLRQPAETRAAPP